MSVATSQRYQNELKQSHTYVSRLVARNGDSVFDLNVVNASVKQVYDATSRWQLDARFLVPDAYTADDLHSLIQQRLTTITAYRGIVFADDTEESFVCGTFYTADVDFAEEISGVPTLQVAAYDQSIRAQGDVSSPFYIPAGSKASLMVPLMLQKKVPNMQFMLATSQFTTPDLLVTENMDLWSEAQRLLASNGQDLYITRDDVCTSTIRPLTPSTDYVWHFDENESPDFKNVRRSATNDLFPNVVNVVGTNPAAPGVFGQAADMDPTSRTYRYGSYGEQVRTFRSELVTSSLQAAQMAQYLLGKFLGPQDQLSFECIPNPALDVGDTVALTRASMGLNATRMIVVEINMPLGNGMMTVVCRRSILTNVESAPVRV